MSESVYHAPRAPRGAPLNYADQPGERRSIYDELLQVASANGDFPDRQPTETHAKFCRRLADAVWDADESDFAEMSGEAQRFFNDKLSRSVNQGEPFPDIPGQPALPRRALERQPKLSPEQRTALRKQRREERKLAQQKRPPRPRRASKTDAVLRHVIENPSRPRHEVLAKFVQETGAKVNTTAAIRTMAIAVLRQAAASGILQPDYVERNPQLLPPAPTEA